jgi:hypothetical protein
MRPQTVTLGASTGERDEIRIVGRPDVVAALAQIAQVMTDLAGGERLVRLLAQRLTATEGEMEREAKVLDAMLPPVEALTDAATTQLRWNALARRNALQEFGALTSAQLAEMRGANTTNPHATTGRWLTADRVFAIETPSGRLFPAFQFAQGEPRPVIRRALTALDHQLRGWELLAWFTGSNGHLAGARPVDRLDEAPDEVVAAAAHQASLSED